MVSGGLELTWMDKMHDKASWWKVSVSYGSCDPMSVILGGCDPMTICGGLESTYASIGIWMTYWRWRMLLGLVCKNWKCR